MLRLGLHGRDMAASAMAKPISRSLVKKAGDREGAGAWHGHGELACVAAVMHRA